MDDTTKWEIQARELYVLMKKDYRISRNIRALWFFQHLNKSLQFTPQEHLIETNDELQVASVVADDEAPCVPGLHYNVALIPSTRVTFVARRYRFVILLDVSPSVSSVDTSSCCVLYEKVIATLSNFLHGLVLPFHLPGSKIVLSPEVHITVIAYTPVKSFTFNQVLVQGLVVTGANIDNVLASMAVKLEKYESKLADNFKKLMETNRSNFNNSYSDIQQTPAEQICSHVSKGHDHINNPEAGIVNMIRCGMLALQLLPENSSAGLVVITDGCLGVPDANLFEFLLTQLRTSTIACTFLRIGESKTPFGHFGHIPHTELMQFIATATFGSYFDSCPDVTGNPPNKLNVYHKAMFLWSFQRGIEGFRFDLNDENLLVEQSSPNQLVQRLLSHPIHGKLASVMPNIRKRHSETNLNTSLFNVLSVRLREGYTIRDIALTKGETQLDVKLVLPWREYARFEYLVRAAWPLDKNRQVTHTEIVIEGSYDFLHDMTCTKMNTKKMSPFRSANVMKFWQVLQGLSQTDQLLIHLQSFSTNPVYYTLPTNVKEGVPLFYIPLPTSGTPTTCSPSLSTQLNSKDMVLNQFASFWKPVVHLDIKVWQKWMHTHRIGLVLEHDLPLNKNIHIPSSSYRYTMVMCRQAMMALNLFLSSWTTFELLELQAYIKLLYDNPEDRSKPPSSFVLVRITSKAPCLVLRLAFLGGTPGYLRYEIVKELKQKVAALKFPKRGAKTDKERGGSKARHQEEMVVVHKPPMSREWSEIKCCVLLYKPVESIMIRYERMPRDMTKIEEQITPEVSQFLPYASPTKTKSAANLFNSLSRYLLHQRWVWTVQQAGVNSISMTGIGRILSTLTKSENWQLASICRSVLASRVRIQQGFHFGLTNQGIVNMILELDMKDPDSISDPNAKSKQKPTCVVQYILFPPFTKTKSESMSDEDEEMESTEDDGILQIIMECWVEPQHGVAINNTPERMMMEGVTCEQIPAVGNISKRSCHNLHNMLERFMWYEGISTMEFTDMKVKSIDPDQIVQIVRADLGLSWSHLYPQDLECVSSLLTFEHLMYLCQNSVIPTDLESIVNTSTQPGANITQLSPTIQHIEFPFDLLSLLPKSQQAELIYPTFTYEDSENGEMGKKANNLFYSLLVEELSERYHREVTLSEETSLKFLQHLVSRSRATDMYPFPFNVDSFISLVGGNEAGKKSSQSQSKNLKFESQSSKTPKNSTVTIKEPEQKIPKIPAWKCFIKTTSTNSLVFAFIPSTFDDLVLLNVPSVEVDEEKSKEKEEKEASDNASSSGRRKSSSDCESGGFSYQRPLSEIERKSDASCSALKRSSSEPDKKVDDKEASHLTWAIKPDQGGDSVQQVEKNTQSNESNALPKLTIGQEKKAEASNKKCLGVPVYIYDCTSQNLHDSLVSPWDFKLPTDLYTDMTFDTINDSGDRSEQNSPRQLKRVSFSVESIKDEDEPAWRTSWRSQERRSTEGSADDAENLWQQCSNLSEMFYHCYVKGVFQSLQKGYSLDSLDVDAAINNICEEALPLECNMTSFLHASCCHFQNLINEARKESEKNPEQTPPVVSEITKISSVRFMDITDDADGFPSLEPALEAPKIPSVLEIPKVTLNFDLSMLHLEYPCEPLKEIHVLVKDKFLDTVQKWFRQVPSNLDYYFYCPEVALSEGIDERMTNTTASDSQQGLSGNADSSGNMPASDSSLQMDKLSVGTHEERISNASVCDSEESMEDDAILDLDLSHDDRSDQSPLFVNFTCTVKSRLQQYSVSLRNIACCIGELTTILEKFSEVELSDLKITFDLNCLTLPSDLEDVSPKKPSLLRMFSFSSNTGGSSSSQTSDSDGEDTVERGSVSIIDMNHLKDPINHLPQRQHDAVIKCMEEIEWLLNDEIASNLRILSPIRTDALNYVAKHIQTTAAQGKCNVSVDSVPLQFVFGADQSAGKFTEEFQKMSLENYQLVKEQEWYYLSRKRIIAYNYVNATALSTALSELSQWGGQQKQSHQIYSPCYRSEVTDTKTVNVISPVITSKKDKIFDIGSESTGCSSPMTVRSEGQRSSEPKMHSRESSLSHEKRTVSEGLNLETISLINRRKSKELVLKMKQGGEIHVEGKTEKSNEQMVSENTENAKLMTDTHREREITESQIGDHTTQAGDTPQISDAMKMSVVAKSADSPSAGCAKFSLTGTESHVTSAVQSPVVADVSIQLTKTDGQSEPYKTSPDRKDDIDPNTADGSFEQENENILKRCSSFAGFRSQESCIADKQVQVSEYQGSSPIKGPLQSLVGPQGRARHCSAPSSNAGTPKGKKPMLEYTPSYLSSRGSLTEDAYDGDLSEMDDSATMFSESGSVTRMMPTFWLIMHINISNVDLLFQHRESGKETNEETLELRNLQAQVKANVESTCRRVNQQLLLNDLYASRMCHNLLVDAAEEDLSWNLDGGHRVKARHNRTISSSENDDDEEDDDTFERKYLAAAMDLDPGYFDCQCVWRTYFYLHPGLKRGTGRGTTMSIGIKALRSVLNPMSVNNRNNMFVIKEMSTDSVYYLRLKEIQSSSSRSAVVTEDADSLSQSGSLRPPDFAADRDGDSASMVSSSSCLSLSQKVAPQDCVELSVHGIDEAGKEIKEDLVQVLQKKLDEATLDKISEMLRRNPQCQLDNYDVQFIQKPGSDPSSVLHLTISNRASPLLAAVMYYLRQNLLQFLHPPKYKSYLPDHQFSDKFDGSLMAIPSDQAFLYVPPHTARKTGISVVSLCLVDGQGNQVKLLQCPKPSGQAYMEIETKLDMESFVVTQTYDITKRTKRPGPTALIQFHIWQVGDVDIPILHEKLTLALKHALCDVTMEYHILTAPLCTVPKHIMDIHPPPPTHSAPTSPFQSMPAEEFRERKFSMITAKKPSITADRRPSLQNTSRLNSLRDALIHSTKRITSPTQDGPKGHDGMDAAHTPRVSTPRVGSPRKTEAGHMLTYYECGERGTLHRIYADLLEQWFIFCSQLETPSVNKASLTIKSRFSVDYILQEFIHIVSRACPTMSTKVYKMLPKEVPIDMNDIGVLYLPNRSPLETGRRMSETSLDLCRPMTVIPGADRNFTAVGRDLEQWYNFLYHPFDEDEDTEQYSNVKGRLTSQKFAAHIPSAADAKTFGMFLESSSLIPRQQFLLLCLRNKEIMLYGYNWTNDAFNTLSKHMAKLVQWNNCRSHLLSNVVTQKCGLFSHYLYGDDANFLDKISQQMDTLEQLIILPAPPPPGKEKLSRTHSMSSVRETNLPFDVTFKDLYPNKPLHVSYLACQSDCVKQYGQQAQDIRLDSKKHFDKINSIYKLYVMWVQKRTLDFPVAEAIIQQLKQASRLFHYCATPLLFSTRWRQNILEKFKACRQDSVSSTCTNTPETKDTKSRSRHGSGNSTGSARTKRTDSNELKKRPSLPSFKETQGDSIDEAATEEEWHFRLRSVFIMDYMEYLKTIGFHYVWLERSQDKGIGQRRSSTLQADTVPQSGKIEIKATETHNLQKTVSGGVLLIEISFRDEYFCVKLYTCDHSKLGITVNQQLKLLFVDECEKCKDLIHVHSFAHDFHLRCIQDYLCGAPDIFKPGYYLSGLLNDFVKVYAYAPSFSRNFLQREVISIPEPYCSSQELYDYMLQHAKLHSMNVLRMVYPSDLDYAWEHSQSKNQEHALISHERRQINARDENSTSLNKMESYTIGLVILQDCPANIPTVGSNYLVGGASQGGGVTSQGVGGVSHSGGGANQTGTSQAVGGGEKPALKLQFYMILTSSQTKFPHQYLDRDRGLLNRCLSLPSGEKTLSGDLKDQIAVVKPVSVREHSTNYLGFSNKHQPPMYQLLQQEAVKVKKKIEKMALLSMDKCRRDTLWTKMLVNQGDDSSSKKRSDVDDKDPLGRLTFHEFQEMLDRVHKVPLCEMDQRLVPFENMSTAWYQGLAQVLNNRYPDNVKRSFINPEKSGEQHHIILNPKFLDLFMMLSVDSVSNKTGLYAVFRKQDKEQECICPGGQNLPEQSVQSHMEQFVNTCCFHLWSSML